MASKLFLEKLLLRLKTGNARSIHLNALPGRFARLDLYDLVNIDQSLHLSFLRKLLSGNKFDLQISIDPKILHDREAEEVLTVKQIIKKLNSLYYQHQDEFLEHGTKTFAFGYPLLIKRDADKPSRILKAPLIIWYLDILKDIHKGNTWRIRRTDDHPVIFNEVLRSHLETHDRIVVNDLFHLFEEEVSGEEMIVSICNAMLEKLGTASTDYDTEIKVLPGTNRESIEKLSGDDPWIRWSGIFGLYKTQKQSIIRDVETLLANPPNEQIETDAEEMITGRNFAAVPLDPSQEAILNGVKQRGKVIIQGPPGTGKSQSLTALISDSLYRGRNCLVVCEKKTALDVIYNNLAEEGLANLCISIDDIHRDRRKLVDQVRAYLESRNEEADEEFRHIEHDELVQRHRESANRATGNIKAMNSRCFGDDNLTSLMANIIRKKRESEWMPFETSATDPIPDLNYEEFRRMSSEVATAGQFYSSLPGRLTYDIIDDSHFKSPGIEATLFPDILSMLETIGRIQKAFDDEQIEGRPGKLFNERTKINSAKIGLGQLLVPRIRRIKASRELILAEYGILKEHFQQRSYFSMNFPDENTITRMDGILPAISTLKNTLEQLYKHRQHFEHYQSWRQFLVGLSPVSRCIMEILSSKVELNQWALSFEIWYKDLFIRDYASRHDICGDLDRQLAGLAETDEQLEAEVPKKILSNWSAKQKAVFKKRTINGVKHLYNYRRNKKYGKRNSLRKIIHQDLELFTTTFPVVMVNPSVCSSILPLEPGVFDHVIFDESSQLRIEDTFAALLRGRRRIISGDRHQMPPTSYFVSSVVLMDEADADETDDVHEAATDEFLADSTSLLEYGMDTDFEPEYLDFHYRSAHPDLIAFSNAAFYGNRLVPMPPDRPETPFEFFQVDGTYNKQRTNEDEARAVVEYIYNNILPVDGNYPSVGIATFNLNQRNLIWDLLMEATYSEDGGVNENSVKLDQLISSGLFVKNLENIQGDERDIILISTTYGRDREGKFRQLFGPVTQAKGYQLLNVIISRAKKRVAVFTSVPENVRSNFQEAIENKGNTGKGIFYSYLEYAQACAAGQTEKKQRILDLLSFHCTEKPYLHQQSGMPLFLQLVYSAVLERYGKENVAHNYRYGGFVLEIAILRDGQPLLAITTSIAARPSSTSYRLFLFKEKMLRLRGVESHFVDAYAWYGDWASEEQKLIERIDKRISL